MRTTLVGALFGIGLLFAGTSALAHHSFAAEFDPQKPIKIKGILTKMEWVNPHGWIYVDVKGEDGTVVNWAVETGGPGALLRRGVRKSDFTMGVEITIEGFLSKSGKPVANGTSVTLADGRSLFLANQ